jgi:hypothetical protein
MKSTRRRTCRSGAAPFCQSDFDRISISSTRSRFDGGYSPPEWQIASDPVAKANGWQGSSGHALDLQVSSPIIHAAPRKIRV